MALTTTVAVPLAPCDTTCGNTNTTIANTAYSALAPLVQHALSSFTQLAHQHRRRDIQSSPATNLSAMGLGNRDFNPNALFAARQRADIQSVSVAVASVSVLACLLSLYWFSVMRRNFRRQYVAFPDSGRCCHAK